MKYGILLNLMVTMMFICQCEHVAIPTENVTDQKAAVSGRILQSDGTTPAVGAQVMIRPADLLIDPTENALGKTISVQKSVQTDGRGVFSFDASLEPGSYLIEAKNENDIVVINSVEVPENKETVTTRPATLKPAGAIKGRVILSDNSDAGHVFVLAYGIDRFASIDEDGSFFFDNLGEETYSLRFVSTLDLYGVYDTSDIAVTSGKTTDIGEITMPIEELPIPQIVEYSLDTVRQQVTIKWNKCTGSNISGYAIYRRRANSNEVFPEPMAVHDSYSEEFIDSSVIGGNSYEYRITTKGFSHGEESFKSEGVFVDVVSYFSVSTTYDIAENTVFLRNRELDFAVADNGDIYFCDTVNHCIQVYDKSMDPEKKIGEGYLTYPKQVAIDENGNLFVLCSNPTIFFQDPASPLIQTIEDTLPRLYRFNAEGTIVDSLNDAAAAMFPIADFHVHDEQIFCLTGGTVIGGNDVSVSSYNGELQHSWQYCSDDNLRKIICDSNNRLYVFMGQLYPSREEGARDEVFILDMPGTFNTMIEIEGSAEEWEGFQGMAYSEDLELLYLMHIDKVDREYNLHNHSTKNIIRAVDKNGEIVATCRLEIGLFASFELSADGEIIVCHPPVRNADGKVIFLNPPKM